MADGTIKSKLQLEGEQQYKQALNDAYRSLRVLRSELKAETAELGRNATAQDKARAKSQSLQKQIAEQEKIVRTLEQALKDSKVEYAENQEVQDKWEEKLNKAREALANMKNQMGDAQDALRGLGDSMRDAGAGSQEAAQAVVSLNDCLSSIGDVVKGVGNSLSGIFSASVDTMRDMVSEMYSLMSEAWAAAGEWNQIQSMWGGNLEDIEKVFLGAQLQGVDAGQITGGIQKMITNVHNGNKETLAALKAMGISEGDFDSHWDFYMGVMQELASRHGSDRDKLTTAIFGEKSGAGQRDVVGNWNDMMDKYGTDVEGTGLKLYEDELQQLDEVSHKIVEIQGMWNILKLNLGAKLSDILNIDQLSEDTLDILRDLGALLNADKDAKVDIVASLDANITKLIEDISATMENLGGWLQELGGDLKSSDNPIVAFIGKLIDNTGKLLDWLGENGDKIAAALDIILPAIIANKATEAVTGKSIGGWMDTLITTTLSIANMKLLGSALGGAAKTGIAAQATGTALGSSIASLLTSKAFLIGSGIGAGLAMLFKMDTSDDDSVTDANGNPTEVTKDLVERGILDPETYEVMGPQDLITGERIPISEYNRIQEEKDAAGRLNVTEEQRAAAEAFYDVWRNWSSVTNPTDEMEEQFDSSWADLEKAFEGQDDLLDRLNGLLDTLPEMDPTGWMNNEDLPAGWFADVSGALNRLSQSDEYRGANERSLPGLIESACERGTAKKPVQVTVTLDGNVIMDYVDRGLADSYHFRG